MIYYRFNLKGFDFCLWCLILLKIKNKKQNKIKKEKKIEEILN